MKRLLWLCLTLTVPALLLNGCANHPERTVIPPGPFPSVQTTSPGPLLFFPVQMDKYIGSPQMASLAYGILALDNSCLRLKPPDGKGESNLPVWPPGFSARIEGQVVYIIDRDGRTIAKTGDSMEVGGGQVTAQVVETYIGYSLPAYCEGPYWLVGNVVSPTVPASPPTSVPALTANINREQAIAIASKTLPASIVERADISSEFHVWYWEIVFDNLHAGAEELMPYPLKPPYQPPGQPTVNPYPGIWQSVIITINAETGDLKSAGAQKAPEPGPYVSREQAIQSAREMMLRTPDGINWGVGTAWFNSAQADAYLRGDRWIVLFWDEGIINHFKMTVNAKTGEASGASRG
jgi:hypothetical protein